MNTERFHAIATAALGDIQSTKSIETISKLTGSLQNQVNQPQVPTYQQQVSVFLATLNQALLIAPSNDFSPAWKQGLEELGLYNMLGKRLQVSIQSIFEKNQITPSIALKELQDIQGKLSKQKDALEKIVAGFSLLGIGAEKLQSGECEIGFLIPRLAVNNKLSKFAEALEDFDKIFSTFAELTTGKRTGFEIRTISSSDLSVFLEMLPIVAASVSIVVERIITTYKNILEIRKLHGELNKKGVPKKQLKGVLAFADSKMKEEIEKLITELLEKFYKKGDAGRRNELSNELRFSIGTIANRIDKGYSIEIRVQPVDDASTTKKPTSEDKKYIELIMAASRNLEFLKLNGIPILFLPESPDKQKSK